jgi:hypothetical protein
MSTVEIASVATASPPEASEPSWRLSTLVAFRWCVVYFGLYVATTQMLPSMVRLPMAGIPLLGMVPPLRNIFIWIGTHVLQISGPIRVQGSGSGDKLFDWVQVFSLLLIAVVVTAVWSVIDRQRRHHAVLNSWFRLFIRFALGTTMMQYGLSKVVPLQMPVIFLNRLVEPFGNFSPMGVLWTSIGAAPGYEIFAGSAELLGGALLFVPRTALLGALICLLDAITIFTLNMTYDVPVKLFSFHLILLSLVLLAPNGRSLIDMLLLNRSARAVSEPPVGQSRRVQRGWRVAQISYGAYVLLLGAMGSIVSWQQFGGGAPKSPLFGIWEIETMSMDGQVRPPLLTDESRWRRAIFQAPTTLTLQRMDDSFEYFGVAIDVSKRTMSLTARGGKESSTLTFDRPTPERLVLDGPIRGRPVHLELALRDPNSFLLKSRGFNWVQEVPFNR